MAMNLNDVPASRDPVHLLLIADSKMGKSTFAAQAALDGFTLLYVDSDNGISALRRHLKDDAEAMQRVHYIPTQNPSEFLRELFEATTEFRWNLREDKAYLKNVAKPEDDVLVINPRNLMSRPDLILVIDSWTAVAYDAISGAAKKAGASAVDFQNQSQAVYGSAGNLLTYLCNVLQGFPTHVIVLAHGAHYERYSKPTKVANPKQKDMTLEETLEVPVSSSNPQGAKMGKYFNHIAWLIADAAKGILIDYTIKPRRVGGGPPNRVKPVSELPFSALQVDKPEGTPLAEEILTVKKASEMGATGNLPAGGATKLALKTGK